MANNSIVFTCVPDERTLPSNDKLILETICSAMIYVNSTALADFQITAL